MSSWKLTSATAKFFEASGHGVVFEISGQCPIYTDVSRELRDESSLTVAGPCWACLPAGVEMAAKMTVLPISLYGLTRKVEKVGNGEFRIQLNIATKTSGQFGVLHGTIRDHLQKMVARGGDRPFAIEIVETSTGDIRFAIPTRPSLILASLAADSPRDIVLTGPVPDFHKPTVIGVLFDWGRWLLLPLLFAVAAAALAFLPALTLPRIPEIGSVIWMGPRSANATSFARELPPVPSLMSQAWQLGQLELQLTAAEQSRSDVSAILSKASTILEKPSVSPAQLHGIPARIAELEAAKGIIARVTGFFTFVNIIWLAAILGITVSVGPVIILLARPFAGLMRRLIRAVWTYFLLPLIKLLHNLGVWELLAYLVCFQLVAEGAKSPREWGFFVSITGLLLALPSVVYTTFLHGAPLGKRLTSPSFVGPMLGSWVALCWFPWAVFYQSRLLAFCTVLSVYSALGFSVLCFGLCWFIGFDSDDAMHRVAVSSTILLIIFSALRIAGTEPAIVVLFSPAIQVLGTCLLLLALLIISSHWNNRSNSKKYILWQLVMISILAAMFAVGNIWALTGITNSALTFSVLYGMEKYCELHDHGNWNLWVAILLFSVALWRIALFLHTHPRFIVAMFQGFD